MHTHREIFAAIQARDPVEASQLMRSHIGGMLERI